MSAAARGGAGADAGVKKSAKRAKRDWSGHIIEQYELGGRVGSGTFADVYEGRRPDMRHGRICMKLEERETGNLAAEYRILKTLANAHYSPRVYDYMKLPKWNMLVLELMGPSLDALMKKGTGRFSTNTVCAVAARILDCIRHVHAHGFIHRDIKPHNFVVGLKDRQAMLYVLDFGLAKSYMTAANEHCPFRTEQPFVGTARYVSVNTHKGYEQGRRDDVESMAYMLVLMVQGKLPWQGLPQKDKQARHDAIHAVKHRTSSAELCEGIPRIFQYLIDHAKSLRFEECPDYTAFIDEFTAHVDPSIPMDWIASGLAKQLTDEVEASTVKGFAKASAARYLARERERGFREARALEP